MESRYRIGQGDTVEIVVWAGQKKEESLSGEYFVFASGVIEMPLIGSFDDGETLEEGDCFTANSFGVAVHSKSPCQTKGS